MRWALFFIVLAVGGLALLITVCERAPLWDLDELEDDELNEVKGPQ